MQSRFGRIRMQLGREQIILVSLAVIYVVTGRAGLAFGYVNPTATAVFPPAGIALGALLVLGYKVWPVILLAATLLLLLGVGRRAGRVLSSRWRTRARVCSSPTW